MIARTGSTLIVRLVLAGACALSLPGCNGIADYILGEAYGGPQPAPENITNEIAIVRSLEVTPSSRSGLVLERVRFADAGDPHNVNRVIQAGSGEAMREAVAALHLSRGDRVVVSTTFVSVTNTIGNNGVPDWPGHKAYEYPIGIHAITAIARATD
ncbi:MAG TPA: hypothetical protein VEY93_08685 [Longimicrobium sp.]|nr:hypothetical protein [Longimicrobium sp.]